MELRTGIHKITEKISDLQVTIYLDGLDKNFKIGDDNCHNKLVVQFCRNGNMDFTWIDKSTMEKAKEAVYKLASKVTDIAVSILTEFVVRYFKIDYQLPKIPELAWSK